MLNGQVRMLALLSVLLDFAMIAFRQSRPEEQDVHKARDKVDTVEVCDGHPGDDSRMVCLGDTCDDKHPPL